jgi:hypothetical protein
VRYHGQFAPRAAGRAALVLAGAGGTASTTNSADEEPARLAWADLLRRVFRT